MQTATASSTLTPTPTTASSSMQQQHHYIVQKWLVVKVMMCKLYSFLLLIVCLTLIKHSFAKSTTLNAVQNGKTDPSSYNKVKYGNKIFVYSNDKSFIPLSMEPFNPSNENVDKHDDKLSISSTKIDLKDKKDQTKKKHGFSTIVRIHAALMIFGWMGCMTVAILMVRFNRNSWPDKKLFGSKVWFAAHRYLMIIGWLAIVISYVIMFIETKGWHKTTPHSVMGIVAGILATIQMLNSFIRPQPNSKYRCLYDYGHWLIGNFAHLLAISNIINSGLKRSTTFLWLIIAYLLVYLLFSDLLRKLENFAHMTIAIVATLIYLMMFNE
ncbi:DOMON domain-containing protein frrs1L [Blomia tropicalis]|nr:DOMON domain-containing protein frrs1L [Blomia tropicalis]